MKSGPTSIHVSENCDENHNKTKQIDDNYPPELVHSLRAEIFALKEWKSRATQEIVDRDCALVDLEQELGWDFVFSIFSQSSRIFSHERN